MFCQKFHYQYNDHEAFFGRLITGNVHRAHDHIHDLQRLQDSSVWHQNPPAGRHDFDWWLTCHINHPDYEYYINYLNVICCHLLCLKPN